MLHNLMHKTTLAEGLPAYSNGDHLINIYKETSCFLFFLNKSPANASLFTFKQGSIPATFYCISSIKK